MEAFFTSFLGTFLGILKIGLIVVVAGWLVRRGILGEPAVKGLSDATILVFLPCLVFSNVLRNFDPSSTPFWWMLPLIAIAVSVFGFLLSWLFFFRELPAKLNLLPVAFIQNAGYLVLPIGKVLVPDQFDTFALFVFLYIMVHNPIIWSVGKILVIRSSDPARNTPFTWRALITPPLAANLIALFLVFTSLRRAVPEPILEATELLGMAAVPVATFVLGATLGGIPILWNSDKWDSARIVLIKLIIIPAAMWVVLWQSGLAISQPLLSLFLMLQASVAPATALVLAIRSYGGDLNKVGTLFVVVHLASLLTIPFWVAMLELAR